MMNKLATGVVLASLSLPVLADTNEPGFYVGGGAGRVTLEDTILGIHIEAKDTGYKAFAGYRFHEYGSLEASYLTGTPHDTISGVLIESDASAFQASGLWQVPINNQFEAFVRFSVVWWEAENSWSNGFSRFAYENDGTDIGFGIGAAVHITPKLGLRVEYEGAELDGTDLRALSLAGLVRF